RDSLEDAFVSRPNRVPDADSFALRERLRDRDLEVGKGPEEPAHAPAHTFGPDQLAVDDRSLREQLPDHLEFLFVEPFFDPAPDDRFVLLLGARRGLCRGRLFRRCPNHCRSPEGDDAQESDPERYGVAPHGSPPSRPGRNDTTTLPELPLSRRGGDLPDVAPAILDHSTAVAVRLVPDLLDHRRSGVGRAPKCGVGVGDIDVEKRGKGLPGARSCHHENRVPDPDLRGSRLLELSFAAEDTLEEPDESGGILDHDARSDGVKTRGLADGAWFAFTSTRSRHSR